MLKQPGIVIRKKYLFNLILIMRTEEIVEEIDSVRTTTFYKYLFGFITLIKKVEDQSINK